MTAPQSAQAFLMGGGGRSAKFETPGDTITGTIVAEPELRQQTDIKDNKPLVWDDGSPKMQLVVKLQTELRDDADDDGVRALYIKGGFKSPTMQKAVSDAVRAAGAQGLAVGGRLTVRFTGTGPASGVGMSPPKYYAAQYEKPQAGAAFLSDPTLTAQPAAAPQQAWTQPAAPAPQQQPMQQQPMQQQPMQPAAAAPAPGMVQLPDGSVVTAEVAALLQQVSS